jgi:hypothetical protein
MMPLADLAQLAIAGKNRVAGRRRSQGAGELTWDVETRLAGWAERTRNQESGDEPCI